MNFLCKDTESCKDEKLIFDVVAQSHILLSYLALLVERMTLHLTWLSLCGSLNETLLENCWKSALREHQHTLTFFILGLRLV